MQIVGIPNLQFIIKINEPCNVFNALWDYDFFGDSQTLENPLKHFFIYSVKLCTVVAKELYFQKAQHQTHCDSMSCIMFIMAMMAIFGSHDTMIIHEMVIALRWLLPLG